MHGPAIAKWPAQPREKKKMKKILLLGDSLIEYGDWQKLLPGYQTMNRGHAGETTGELAARIAGEVISAGEPDLIVLLSGTNDLLMGDLHFPWSFATMLPRLRQLCEEIPVIVVGLAPMQMVRDSVDEVNSRLEKIAREAGCMFLDLVKHFDLYCRPVGNPCFLMDGVHFSPHGYEVLAGALAEKIKTGFRGSN